MPPLKEFPIRFHEIDWDEFEKVVPLRRWWLTLHYLSSVWLWVLFEVSVSIVDIFAIAFLMPKIGLGDMAFPNLDQEYSVPYGHQRIIVIVCLMLLIVLRFTLDFLVRGIFGSRTRFVASIYLNNHAFTITSMRSYREWRLMTWLTSQFSKKELFALWLHESGAGWKRFLLLKTPLAIAFAFTLFNGVFRPYEPIDDELQIMAVTYIFFRFIVYLGELTNKTAALGAFLVALCTGFSSTHIKATLNSTVYRHLSFFAKLTQDPVARLNNVQPAPHLTLQLPSGRDMVELNLDSPAISPASRPASKIFSPRYKAQ
jgi:hypothetical protein